MQFKKAFYFLLLAVLFASCANNSGENISDKSSSIQCYRYANAGDTIILKLLHVGKSITGTLVYKMPQKNTSKGTIQGAMREDLLVIRYTAFVDSSFVQQKVFKLKGKYFVEGQGERITENGQIKFKNIDELQFDDVVRLNQIVCE